MTRASSSSGANRQAGSPRRPGGDAREQAAALEVHIENDDVWVPLGNGRLDISGRVDGPRGVHAVVEGQLDQLHKYLSVKEKQDPRGAANGPPGGLVLLSLHCAVVRHDYP